MAIEFITIDEMQNAKTDIMNYLDSTPIDELIGDIASIINIEPKQSDIFYPIREKVNMHFTGENVQWGKISTRFLGNVLSGFQQVIDALGNALDNNATEGGRIPNDVLRQTDFVINAPYAASFGIVMTADVENTLFPSESLISRSLNHLYKLLQSSDNADMFCDVISDLGSRVLNDYTAWIRAFEGTGINFEIERHDVTHTTHKWEARAADIPKIVNVLKSVEKPQKVGVEINGLLVGIDLRLKTFDLVNEEMGPVTGRGSDDVLLKCLPLMNKNINACLTKTIFRNSYTSKEKTIWHIDDIKL